MRDRRLASNSERSLATALSQDEVERNEETNFDNSFAGSDYSTGLNGAGYSSLLEDSIHVTIGREFSGCCISGIWVRIWTRNF
jgi:hypothetical protein